jgi:hypothetical protein
MDDIHATTANNPSLKHHRRGSRIIECGICHWRANGCSSFGGRLGALVLGEGANSMKQGQKYYLQQLRK